MSRSSIARRFLPLAVVLAVQLLIIAVVPSKSPTSRLASSTFSGRGPTTGGAITSGQPGTGDVTSPGSPGSDQTATAATSSNGVPGSVGSVGSAGSVGAPGQSGRRNSNGSSSASGAPAALPPGAKATGDTSHCVAGRQYDPAIFAWAPACVPKFSGDNGGKTSDHGVTKDTITVVGIYPNYGTAVNQILQAQGSLPTTSGQAAMYKAVADFINSHYELYGRKIVMKQHVLHCGSGGQGVPDNACLRNEMREIQANDDPFAVIWPTSVSSETFDELSKLGIVNLGGFNFRDSFNLNHRPYHWDLMMGGTQLVTHVANWYCTRMGGGHAKASFAQSPDLQATNRVLGVISTDDPENQQTVAELAQRLAADCGVKIAHTYFYAQDITTADQQRRAALAKMESNPKATTIMCFCDQVAPVFLYNTEENDNYYPENVIVGTSFTDKDENAQAFDHTLPPDDVTPGHAFANAFGLGMTPNRPALSKDTSAQIWHLTGHAGKTPWDSSEDDTEYILQLGTMLQDAGPNLNPANLETGAFSAAPIAPANNTDEHFDQRGFAPGIYTWESNLREIYYSATKPSDQNGKAGKFFTLNGGHWYTDQFPPGLIQVPPVGSR